MTITVHGPNYSTYVRSVILALEEKGAGYDLAEVDILKGEQNAPSFVARNPFAKVPAFVHDGFELYETGAILRYLDRVLPSPALTPTDPRAAARMDQLIGIADAHFYAPAISTLAIQRLVMPMMGAPTDEAAITAAMPKITTALAEIERLQGGGTYLVGNELTLADLMLAPIFGYLTSTPEAASLLAPHEALRRWWAMIGERPSMRKTAPRLG